jgi:predicted ATP-grasp superfamily ATP-dependent carboligase
MVLLAARIGGKPVLIPSADLFVTAIARHADRLAPHYTFLPSSVAVQALLATKKKQYELAHSGGLPVPRTSYIETGEELERFARVARFPCLLKPVHFREWERFPAGHPLLNQKVIVAESAEELMSHYKLAEAITSKLVAQEVIEGPDTAKMVYLSCYGSNGDRLGHCLLRQLRTYPPCFGSASVVEPIQDEETDAVCDQFLRGLNYHGICELELKRDSRDGVVKLIEANPRYSVTADAGTHAGVELGWLHYLDLLGLRPAPMKPNQRQFRHIVLRRDFACFRPYRKLGMLPLREIAAAYRPPVAFFDFDIRDWRVTGETVIELAKILVAPVVRKIFPRNK